MLEVGNIAYFVSITQKYSVVFYYIMSTFMKFVTDATSSQNIFGLKF